MEPEDLTSEQRRTLNQLRQNVGDVIRDCDDDYNLSRWLVARSWNIAKAEKMYRTSLEWRKLHDMDNILSTWNAPEVLRLYAPGGFCGVDKGGSPVWIENLGHLDMKGIFASARVKDIFRNRLYVLQKAEFLIDQEWKKRRKHPGGITMIYDMENFGMKQLWKPGVDLVGQMFYTSETNFPELLKAAYIINAPRIFSLAYSLMKPFLHERTKNKVHILGNDWKDVLLKVIDADKLPVHWGGTLTDPDGDIYCRSKVSPGGDVPTSFYNTDHAICDRSGMTEATVGRGSKLKVELNVEKPNSLISWQFLTEAHDVGFGIYRQPVNKEREVLLESRRVNSHQIPEVGSVLATSPGIYVARFDNTYSWVNTKKLFYTVEVFRPSDTEQTEDKT